MLARWAICAHRVWVTWVLATCDIVSRYDVNTRTSSESENSISLIHSSSNPSPFNFSGPWWNYRCPLLDDSTDEACLIRACLVRGCLVRAWLVRACLVRACSVRVQSVGACLVVVQAMKACLMRVQSMRACLMMMQAMKACLMKVQSAEISSWFSPKFHLYQLEISSLFSSKFHLYSARQTSLSSHLFASQLVTPGRDESRSCLSRMKFTCWDVERCCWDCICRSNDWLERTCLMIANSRRLVWWLRTREDLFDALTKELVWYADEELVWCADEKLVWCTEEELVWWLRTREDLFDDCRRTCLMHWRKSLFNTHWSNALRKKLFDALTKKLSDARWLNALIKNLTISKMLYSTLRWRNLFDDSLTRLQKTW